MDKPIHKGVPRRAMGLTALLCGLAGAVLRIAMYQVSFEESGLLRWGDWVLPVLVGLSLLTLGALWLQCRKCRCSPTYEDNFPASDLASIGEVLFGGLLAIGGLAGMLAGQDWVAQLAGGALLVTGAGYVAGFNRRRQGRAPWIWRVFLPCLAWAVWLLQDFWDWTRDPQVAQYAFRMMLSVFSMLAFYHREAFALGIGKAPSATVTGWGAVYFALVSLPDAFKMSSPLEGICRGCLCLGVIGLLGAFGPLGVPAPEEPEPAAPAEESQKTEEIAGE